MQLLCGYLAAADTVQGCLLLDQVEVEVGEVGDGGVEELLMGGREVKM